MKNDSIRHPRKRAFLAAFAKCGHVGKAAKLAGVERRTPNEWKREDPVFAQAYDEAVDAFAETLEIEADRRAKGIKIALYDGKTGKRVGYRLEYSDRMLELRLKALKPAAYRENFDHTLHGEVTQVIRIDAPPPPKPAE